MTQFVVSYVRSTGSASIESFEGVDAHMRAMRARFDREDRANADLEVVVLSAPSIEALHATHERYFSSASELADDLQAAVSA